MRQWLLVGKFGAAGESRSKAISPIPFRVGRRPETALTLPRATVSGQHAEFYVDGERLLLRDLGSTNGTFINGERIDSEVEVHEDDVIQFADVALKVARDFQDENSRTMSEDFCDHALARVQFEKLISDRVVTPYFQPIVDLRTGRFMAFEVLARSRLVGLETPGRMFAAAADLQMEGELSDVMRVKGVETSLQFPQVPPIYLNTHPIEFQNTDAWGWIRKLRDMSPRQKLTIEVHEAAVTDVAAIKRFRAILQEYDIGLAFDDFGAGQARIAELAGIRPDCLKFDRRIITGLDQADEAHRRFVRCLIDGIRDIGVVPLAEGVETAGEYQVCCDLGFELAQGYWIGLPSPLDVYVDWPDHVVQRPSEQTALPSSLDDLLSLPKSNCEDTPASVSIH